MAQQMNSLQDRLGDDICFLIVEQISTHSDLHALCLVSKSSRAFAERFLYSKIEWTWLEDRPPPITTFLRTILRRPELAAHVRSLALLGDSFRYKHFNPPSAPEFPMDESGLAEAVKAVEATGVSFADHWGRELRNNRTDAFIALLLSRLPSLQHLTVKTDFTTDTEFIGLFLKAALLEKSLPALERLQDVVCDYHHHFLRKNSGRNTPNILPIFYLPHVRNLSITLDNPVTFNWPIILPPNPSSITSLTVSMLRESHLHHILSVTSRLRTLNWILYYCESHEHATCTSLIELDKLGNALYHVRKTLEKLTISSRIDQGYNFQGEEMQLTGSLRKLSNFDQLQHLELPFEFLVASLVTSRAVQIGDVAPRYLQYLIITDELIQDLDYDGYDDDEWPDEAVSHHITLWVLGRQLPKLHLRKLVVRSYLGWFDPPGSTDSLRNLAAQEGFEFEFRHR